MSESSKNSSDRSLFFTLPIVQKEPSQSKNSAADREVAAGLSGQLSAQAKADQSRANQAKTLFLPHLTPEQSLQAHQASIETDTLIGACYPTLSRAEPLVQNFPAPQLLAEAAPEVSEPLKALAPANSNSHNSPIYAPIYDSEQTKVRVKANRHAGHSVALTVSPGGNGKAIAGYGKRDRTLPRGTIPGGSALLMLIGEQSAIPDVAGSLLECMDIDAFLQAKPAVRDRLVDQQLDSMNIVDPIIRKETLVAWEHIQILEEYDRFDDCWIEPPEDLSIFERSVSVDKSTRLSDILEENTGCYTVALIAETIDKQSEYSQ